MRLDVFKFKQLECWAVHRKQIESAPGIVFEMAIEIFNEMLVEFDKRGIFEFHAGFWQGHFRDEMKGDFKVEPSFKEVVQFVLIRSFDEVDQEKH